MALIFDWWYWDFVFLSVVICLGLYMSFMDAYAYWRRLGFPFLKPTASWPKQIGVKFGEFYQELAGNEAGGVFQYQTPTLVLRDLDLIESFLDPGVYFDEEQDALTSHCFLVAGGRWQWTTKIKTPEYTSGDEKSMFNKVLVFGNLLCECLQGHAETVDVKDLLRRYTTDVILCCIFGMGTSTLKNYNAASRPLGKSFFETIQWTSELSAPPAQEFFIRSRIPHAGFSYFKQMVVGTLEHHVDNDVILYLAYLKDKGFGQKNSDRVKEAIAKVEQRDKQELEVLQSLVRLKTEGFLQANPGNVTVHEDPSKGSMIDGKEQESYIFFIAGFETSSATVSFCLYELALNPEIQTRLRREIDSVLADYGGSLTYEAMMDMEYLAMVVDETLRKYPEGPTLSRTSKKAFTIPDTGLVVELGTSVVVPVYGIHHDPQYYPDPERFDPQRFAADKKSARHNFAHLPFGAGPIDDVGMRFGLMQIKVALISLLARYVFQISRNTINPLVFDPIFLTLTPKDGVFLKVSNRASAVKMNPKTPQTPQTPQTLETRETPSTSKTLPTPNSLQIPDSSESPDNLKTLKSQKSPSVKRRFLRRFLKPTKTSSTSKILTNSNLS